MHKLSDAFPGDWKQLAWIPEAPDHAEKHLFMDTSLESTDEDKKELSTALGEYLAVLQEVLMDGSQYLEGLMREINVMSKITKNEKVIRGARKYMLECNAPVTLLRRYEGINAKIKKT